MRTEQEIRDYIDWLANATPPDVESDMAMAMAAQAAIAAMRWVLDDPEPADIDPEAFQRDAREALTELARQPLSAAELAREADRAMRDILRRHQSPDA